jgi:hypothetical protein
VGRGAAGPRLPFVGAPPNLALQRTPHRRGAFSAIMPKLGGAGPLSFGVRPQKDAVGARTVCGWFVSPGEERKAQDYDGLPKSRPRVTAWC